jgi:hypothetical protein
MFIKYRVSAVSTKRDRTRMQIVPEWATKVKPIWETQISSVKICLMAVLPGASAGSNQLHARRTVLTRTVGLATSTVFWPPDAKVSGLAPLDDYVR